MPEENLERPLDIVCSGATVLPLNDELKGHDMDSGARNDLEIMRKAAFHLIEQRIELLKVKAVREARDKLDDADAKVRDALETSMPMQEANEERKLAVQEYQIVLDAHGIDRIGQALDCLDKRKRQLEAEQNDL